MNSSKNESRQTTQILSTINIINLFGWSLVLLTEIASLLLMRLDQEFSFKMLQACLLFLRIIQSFGILDILVGVINSGGVTLSSVMQISSRLIITWFYMNVSAEEINKFQFLVIFCWSLADSTRSLYYLVKDSSVTGWLGYNLFIILYPFGLFGEIFVIETYKTNVYVTYFLQTSYIIGFFYLYTYMLKNRRNYYKRKENKSDKTD
jgi:very-long-chain (3R)-3-hydroxyacyl-CoA dehydratase